VQAAKRYVWNDRCSGCGADLRTAAVLFRINEEQELIRCQACRLVSNSRFRSDLENVYDESSFEASSKDAEGGYFSYRELEGALNADYRFASAFLRARLAERAAGARILDIGCGYGFFLKQFVGTPGVELHGVELSRTAAAAASAAGLHVTRAPIEQAELAEPFDFVVCFEAVEHVFDPAALLTRIASLLAPSGHLLLTTPDIGSAWFPLLRRRWPALHPDSHNHYFTRETLAALARRAGFDVVSIRHREVLHKSVRQLRSRMGELFPASRWLTGPLAPLDGKTIPFLSGGSLEAIFRRR
jgi:2-polyprenyl-3-methyl-5-hydroxy-6-metoxy-1,4-benzoquinol methylase